jgi:hypothetical protein
MRKLLTQNLYLTMMSFFDECIPAEPFGEMETSRGPPVFKLGIYLLVNCNQGCRQIVLKQRTGDTNEKKG